MKLAARSNPQAIGLCLRKQAPHVIELLAIDERTHVQAQRRRACDQRLKALNQPFEHCFVEAALNQQAAARRTGLARVLNDGVDDDRDCSVEIGIGKHQLRRFATQLQRDRAVATRCGLGHTLPGGSRPGKRQMIDIRMLAEACARLSTIASDDVERPRREPCLGGEFAEPQ